MALARSLVGNKQTFQEVDEPLFSFWPDPELTREAPMEMYGQPPVKATDPFYLDFLRNVTKLNEGIMYLPSALCSITNTSRIRWEPSSALRHSSRKHCRYQSLG